MVRLILGLLMALLASGCGWTTFLPHTYQAADTRQWATASIPKYKISVDLPVDPKYPWYQDDQDNLVGMRIYRIVPNGIWEPLTFAYISVSVNSGLEDLIPKHGGKYGIPYRCYVGQPYADEIFCDCVLGIDNDSTLFCRLELNRIRSIGYAFYNHDPTCPKKLEDLYKRVLWSIKCDGRRLIQADSPEAIKIEKLKWSDVPKGYETLFAAFGF